MPRINLLPWRETQRREREKQFKVMAAAAVACGIVVTVYAHWMISDAIEAQQARNQVLTKEQARLKTASKVREELEQKRDDLLSRMAIIERLQRSRAVSVRLLNEIAAVLPGGSFLGEIAQSGSTLRLAGRAGSNADVSELMRRLGKSEVVGEPRLVSIVTDDTDHTVDFSLQVVVKGLEVIAPEGAAASKTKDQKKAKAKPKKSTADDSPH